MPQITILSHQEIEHKVIRIAYQIYETFVDEEEIIIAGIAKNGYVFAEKLAKELSKIASLKIVLCEVFIDKNDPFQPITTSISKNDYQNKGLILVDDVLNSGKTLAYGLGVFLNTPHKKIRTVVLVDRSHKIFPIATDFVGLELATVLKEHVDVIMDVEGEEDRVYLS